MLEEEEKETENPLYFQWYYTVCMDSPSYRNSLKPLLITGKISNILYFLYHLYFFRNVGIVIGMSVACRNNVTFLFWQLITSRFVFMRKIILKGFCDFVKFFLASIQHHASLCPDQTPRTKNPRNAV